MTPKQSPLKPPVEGAPGEEMITLSARGYLTVACMVIQQGQEFILPLRAAMGLVGTGEADEVAPAGEHHHRPEPGPEHGAHPPERRRREE